MYRSRILCKECVLLSYGTRPEECDNCTPAQPVQILYPCSGDITIARGTIQLPDINKVIDELQVLLLRRALDD